MALPNLAVQDPNELIAKQYASARKSLEGKKLQAMDELRAQSGRQQALTGMGGGSLMKANEKALTNLERSFLDAENDIASQEAAAKLAESQYARGQAQQESQYTRSLDVQKQQFADSLGLSRDQFEESKSQFTRQLGLATAEFEENKNTNFWNSMMNISKEDVPDEAWNRFLDQYNSIGSRNKIPMSNNYGWPMS